MIALLFFQYKDSVYIYCLFSVIFNKSNMLSSAGLLNSSFSPLVKAVLYNDESIYYSLWRLVSLEVYASLYYKDINKIYISAPLNIFLLRKYFKSECIYESLIEVSFYSAIGRI